MRKTEGDTVFDIEVEFYVPKLKDEKGKVYWDEKNFKLQLLELFRNEFDVVVAEVHEFFNGDEVWKVIRLNYSMKTCCDLQAIYSYKKIMLRNPDYFQPEEGSIAYSKITNVLAYRGIGINENE